MPRLPVTLAALTLLTAGAAASVAPPAVAAPGPGPAAPRAGEAGAFVLGIDGMDPVILQRLMDEGRMPNFKKLATEGTFQQLGTSNPPQSPVAWSNFVTGMNPGGHGIYDFIHRDPRTYSPISSATPPPSGEEPILLSLFGYGIPVAGGDEVVNNRSGKPFWDYLQEAGIDTEVYRIPGNYPPTPSEALTLAGMGTVDMRGTPGEYTWFTDELMPGAHDLKADFMLLTADDDDSDGFEETYRSQLKGPPDALRLDDEGHPLSTPLTTPVTINVSQNDEVAWIRVGDTAAPTSQAVLQVGEWSEWMPVAFDAMPGGMMPLGGIVRFYLKDVRPNLKLYASPVNIDPAAPAQPVATPDGAAEALAERMGPYYTQGMPEEVNALKDGLFDDDDYIKQVLLVHEDGHIMLDVAIERFERGDTSFMYLSDIDLQCHMLWRHGDPKHQDAPHHPAYEAAAAAKHKKDIEQFYLNVDAVLGSLRERLPEDTLLIVMSDHGFQSYHRKVHLNSWLRDEGYLVLNGDKRTGHITGPLFDDEGTPLHDVDWTKTRAYGLGFNGIYLNLEGREGDGIVKPSEADALANEIADKLAALQDPRDGTRAIVRCVRGTEAYSGSRIDEAPDLVVGYDAGYGCSDESTLGEIVEGVFEDNKDRWSGNHLMDPSVVPGILLVNRKLPRDGHDLTDVTATLLDYHGMAVPDDMVGESFLR